MSKKLGYKAAPVKTGPGSMKMKAGKHGAIASKPAKEKSTPMHASTYMSKVISDMRKHKYQLGQPKKSGGYSA